MTSQQEDTMYEIYMEVEKLGLRKKFDKQMEKMLKQDKSNVIIVEGDWYQLKDSLSTYDGVFYDTYGEGDWTKFSEEISSLVKPSAKVTWWNNEPSTNSIQNIDGVDYESINIDPPPNSYFNSNVYYMPKKQF